jgi:hypothetical protein
MERNNLEPIHMSQQAPPHDVTLKGFYPLEILLFLLTWYKYSGFPTYMM